MFRTLIIEDEPYAQKELQLLLSRQDGFIWVGSCGNIGDARLLLQSTQPDLVLMDIELEDGTAFDLLQSLETIPFKIIFVTGFNDQAIRAIKFGALDYIVKPVNDGEFAEALDRVRQAATPQETVQQLDLARAYLQPEQAGLRNRIALRDQYHLRIVTFSDILYCQSNSGYTTFFLTGGKQVVVSRSIKDHERLLPAAQFLRIHQSYIVNAEHIELYHKDGYVRLKDGTQLPVAARKRDEVMKQLSGY